MKTILTRWAVLASILMAGCSSTDDAPRSTSMLVDSVLFHPDRYPVGKWKTEDPSIEDVYFESPNGQKLNGWYTEAKNARAVVLYAEGNGGNITNRRTILDLYRDKLKCTILIFDYEGYGRSEGKPSQSAILADARAARSWLSDRAGIEEKDLVLVGNSLGGAVAVDLAANGGARGLVLENTFASLSELTQAHFGLVASKLVSSKLDSASKIDDYHGPLLQTHGEKDKTVPFAQGKRLFEAANEPKKFIPIADGSHDDEMTPEYIEELDKFLASLPEVSAKTTR